MTGDNFLLLSQFENFVNNKNLQLKFGFSTWFLLADWYNGNDKYILLIFISFKLIWIFRVFKDYVPELSSFDSFDMDSVILFFWYQENE